jgi:hypothetical protein
MQKNEWEIHNCGNFFSLNKNTNFGKKGNRMNYWKEKFFFTSNVYFLRDLLEQKNIKEKKKKFFPQKFVFFLNFKFQKNQTDNKYLFLKFQEESFGARYILFMYLFLEKISKLGKIFLFCRNDFRILQYNKRKKRFFLGELFFFVSLLKNSGFDTNFLRNYYKNLMKLLYWDMRLTRNYEKFKNLIFLQKKKKKIQHDFFFLDVKKLSFIESI